MDDEFELSLADWHRAEAAATDAELAVARLPPGDDDPANRAAREGATALRQSADALLARLLRMAGAGPGAAPHP